MKKSAFLMQSFPPFPISLYKENRVCMEMKQLIERGKRGDKEALDSLYRAYSHRMTGVCRRIVDNNPIAEDLVHDAFILAFSSLGSLKDPDKFGAWLTSIVINVALKYKEGNNNPMLVSLPTAADDIPADETGGETGGEVTIEDMLSMVEQLPEGYRKVFKLSVLEGLSHKEIAGILGIEPHSSSSQLYRAKKMLRRMLSKYWMLFAVPLLIPLGLYLFRKQGAEPGIHRGRPASAKQQETAKGGRPAAETTGTPTGKARYRQYAATVRDTLHQLTGYCTGSAVPADTASRMTAHGEHTDTTQNTTATLPQPPEHGPAWAGLCPDIPAGGKEETAKWSVELAYAGQMNQSVHPHQPRSLYVEEHLGSIVDDPESPTPRLLKIDNWHDYLHYLIANKDNIPHETGDMMMKIAQSNMPQNGGRIVQSARHRMPITYSLALKYQVGSRIGLETGLTYTQLTSEFQTGGGADYIEETQKVRYMGIPLKASYRLWSRPRWSLYTSAGVMLELPLRSTLTTGYCLQNNLQSQSTEHFMPRRQWSAGIGFGAQYHFTPSIGFFVEPSLQYFFGNGSNAATYRTEHPLVLTLPAGLRFSW